MHADCPCHLFALSEALSSDNLSLSMNTTLITNQQAAIPGKKTKHGKGTNSSFVLIYSSHLFLHQKSGENGTSL